MCITLAVRPSILELLHDTSLSSTNKRFTACLQMCAERFSPHYFVQVSIKVVHVQKIHSKKKGNVQSRNENLY